MSKKRICSGKCKKFRVYKPTDKGRYESGQALCLTCDIWIDYKGCHLKGGSHATEDSVGWFCNCCNQRVRRRPRNKVYKEKLRAKQDSSILEQDEMDVDRLNMLIEKSLHMIKTSQNGAYMNDLKMLLGISQEEMSSVATRLIRIIGMSKKEIHYQSTLQDVLFIYDESEYAKEGTYDDTGQQIETEFVDQYDSVHDSQKERQHIYDQLWFAYTTSDMSRALFMKYEQKVTGFSHDIDVVFQKKYIAFKIGGKFFAGIIPQKSKMRCDLRLPKSDLDDPQGLLRDISNVGSWTSGKSSMNISNNDSLEYCINITRQCFERITGNNVKVFDTNKNTHNDDSLKTNSDVAEEIKTLTEQMVNEYATNKKIIDKSLQRRLTKEFIESRSISKIIRGNPEFSKRDILRHVRTSLRLPEELKVMENSGVLHSDPECSLQMALFAVNHYEWDGDAKDQNIVTELALSISKYLSQDISLNQAFKAGNSVHQNITQPRHIQNDARTDVPTAVGIWIATATLHRQYGIDRVFSNKDILSMVAKQDLCKVATETIAMHISSHCVANNSAYPDKHRKLYRVSRGSYRLYRNGDYYNRQRVNGQIEPDIDELPDKYKDLIRWYHEEYCNIITEKTKQEQSEQDAMDMKKQNLEESKNTSNDRNMTQGWIVPGIIPQKDTVFTEHELQSRFAVANSGGIRPSRKNRIIILINSSFLADMGLDIGYDNAVDRELGFVTHVGQGQDDQTMNRFNKSLMLSKQHGYVLLYFEKTTPNKLVFRFPVEYDSHSFGKQKNNSGLLRRVILFNLKIV